MSTDRPSDDKLPPAGPSPDGPAKPKDTAVQAQLDGVVIRLGDVVEIRVNKVSQMPLVWEAGERTTKPRDSSRSHP